MTTNYVNGTHFDVTDNNYKLYSADNNLLADIDYDYDDLFLYGGKLFNDLKKYFKVDRNVETIVVSINADVCGDIWIYFHYVPTYSGHIKTDGVVKYFKIPADRFPKDLDDRLHSLYETGIDEITFERVSL